MFRGPIHRSALVFAGLVLGMGAFALTGPSAAAAGRHVYAMTNAADGNQIVVFDRATDGTLTQAASVSTGGLGTGVGLGSQGAVAIGSKGHWLFAVNAGSNTVTLAVHRSLVYVVNAGSDEISGFRIDSSGLTPLAGSTRPLSGTAVAPAQISFTPSGDELVVTEKATNTIDTYQVRRDGLPSGPRTTASQGETPFGFAFQGRHLIVSEAFGGTPGASALSSYYAVPNGALSTISASVPDTQTAACWVAVARGRYAYTTNTGSNDISSYTIGADGSLTLLSAVAGQTGAGPIDMTVARGGTYLYALNGADGTISAFRLAMDGSLTAIAGASGLPAGAASGITSD
jgi:6-phosphogluconolactonase (cycloisomerase 2 family)